MKSLDFCKIMDELEDRIEILEDSKKYEELETLESFMNWFIEEFSK